MGREHHTRGAETTLDGACVYECFLQWVKFARCPQAFNGGQSTTTRLGGEHDTAGTWHAIHQYIAGATFAGLAAVLDAVIAFLAQHRHQGFVGGNVQAFDDPVNSQFKFHIYSSPLEEDTTGWREILMASSSARKARLSPLVRR